MAARDREYCDRVAASTNFRGEMATRWLNECGTAASAETTAHVRALQRAAAASRCEAKAREAKTVADLDRLQNQCPDDLQNPAVASALSRRDEMNSLALAAELEAIGTGASAETYRQFLNSHQTVPNDNPTILKAQRLYDVRAESERVLAAERERKSRAQAYENAKESERQAIRGCEEMTLAAQRGLLREKEIGAVSGYVNATRMNEMARAIFWCQDQIKAAKARLSELEKNPRGFATPTPITSNRVPIPVPAKH